MRDRMRASRAMSNGPPVQVGANSAGSELSRQVPVDLEADADLNEGRGAPGHWSSSLAFQSSNKLDRGTPSRKPRKDAHLLSKRILLETLPWGSP
jgi:hypothetical protein